MAPNKNDKDKNKNKDKENLTNNKPEIQPAGLENQPVIARSFSSSQEFADIKNMVRRNQQGTRLTFLSSMIPSTSIQTVLNYFFPADTELILDNFNTGEDTSEVFELLGTLVNEFMGTPNLAVSFKFTLVNSNFELLATFSQFPSTWKFSNGFPLLANTLIDSFTYTTPEFQLDSQKQNVLESDYRTKIGYPPDIVANQLDVKNGLSFTAGIKTDVISSELSWILLDQSNTTLNVGGPIEIISGFPVLVFESNATRSLPLFGKELALMMRLFSFRTPENINNNKGTTEVFGQIVSDVDYTIGDSAHQLHFRANFYLQDMIMLKLIADTSDIGLSLNLSDATALSDDTALPSFFPDSFPLGNLSLSEIGATINMMAPSITDGYIDISTDATWDIFNNSLVFKDMKLRIASQFSEEFGTSVTAFTTLGILGKDLEASIELPDLTFFAILSEGETIDIGSMITDLSIPLPGFQDFTCTAFAINGDFKNSYYNIFVDLTNIWHLNLDTGIDFNINEVKLQLGHSGTGNSAYVEGNFSIGSHTFDIMAFRESSDSGWRFVGKTRAGGPISLMAIAGDISKTDAFPIYDITLNAASVEINTATKQYIFYADTGLNFTLPFLATNLDLETTVYLNTFIKQGQRVYEGYFQALLNAGSGAFEVKYEISQNVKSISGYWVAPSESDYFHLSDLLSFIDITNTFDLPSIDLDLKALGIEYDVAHSRFTVSATSKDHGDAFLTAGEDDGSTRSFGFVFGINLKDISNFSSIPVIGTAFAAADSLHINSASILLSEGTFNNYQIGTLPEIGGDSSVSTVNPVAKNAVLKLQTGISIACEIDWSKSGDGDAEIQNVSSLLGTHFNNLVLHGFDYGTTIGLRAILDASITVIGGLVIKEAILEIDFASGEMFFKIGGEFDISMFGSDFTADVLMAISETEATVSGSLTAHQGSTLPSPPFLRGIQLYELDLLMGMFFEPESLLLGIGAKFNIGTNEQQVNSIGLVFQIIADVPNILYASFYMEELDLSKIYQLFVGSELSSSVKEETDQVKAENVSFYWCEVPTTLPDGTVATPGFAFSGEFDVFGFDFFIESEINSTGIVGKAHADPLNLANILKISGDGEQIVRNINSTREIVGNQPDPSTHTQSTRQKTVVKAGGPHLDISTHSSPYLDADWKITLFDIVEEETDIEISNDGVKFTLEYDLAHISEFNLHCTLASWSTFSAGATFELGIDEQISLKKLGIHVGSFHLQTTVSAGFSVGINNNQIQIKIIDAGFHFFGMDFTIPDITLPTNTTSLSVIPGLIIQMVIQKAEEIFASILDPTIWARLVHQGLISITDNIGNILHLAFGLDPNTIANIMKVAGYPINAIADSLKTAFGPSAEIIGNALAFAGFGPSSIVSSMYSIGIGVNAIGDFLNGLGLPTGDVSNIIKGATGIPGDALEALGNITHIY